jgi:hypothetical protein
MIKTNKTRSGLMIRLSEKRLAFVAALNDTPIMVYSFYYYREAVDKVN